MLNLFVKIAWRNLVRNKTYSLINVIGLASGLACFILIAMFVSHELSYDKFHINAERIVRINSSLKLGGSELNLAVTSDPMGPSLKNDYPQVQEFTRLYASGGSKVIRKGSEYITEQRVVHVDSTFFQVFTFEPLKGNIQDALNDPNTVVISESAAKKYFGTADVLGKFIDVKENNSTLYKVTGVIRDMPENSHFHYDFLFSMDNVDYGFNNYLSHNFHTYLLLKPGVSIKEMESKFPEYIDKYVLPQAKMVMQINSIDEFEKSGNRLGYSLIPLIDIHLHSDLFPELDTNGNIQYVYIFSAVALFILILACINFINLATARSMKRAREVGVRKVLGTTRINLIQQFISESTLTVLFSLLLALGLVWLVIPGFNDLAAKKMHIGMLLQPRMLIVIFLLPIIVSLLAGTYPAFFLSSFKPTEVLKGKLNTGNSRNTLRSGLVVFQFATSIILIIATITVFYQLSYIQNRKIGFNKDQVLVIDNTGYLGHNATSFKNEVAKLPGVVNGTFAGYLPVSASARNDNTYSKEPVLSTSNTLNMQTWSIDHEYIQTMGMELIKGRNFSRSFGTDSSAMIINETTASLLGYENPLGKKVYALRDASSNEVDAYTIVGVVKNFNFESMKQKIGPLCFVLREANWATAFRLDPSHAKEVLLQAERKWKAMSTGMPFSYRFLDESFNNMYRAEQRIGKVAIAFAILAILIACLGLFGLATYIAEQRTKEIGVRKVLGASVKNIVLMLSTDFLKLVIIAALIAFPLAWWSMHNWLQDFAYRINLGWWIFVLAGLLAVFIALFTISFQALKAALANPVKSLRTE
jgi:putative ABC transport system permease protein